jgi:hypothetical protein
MKTSYSIILFFVLVLSRGAYANSSGADRILHNKIPRGNMRYNTFAFVLREMERREAKVLVETGTNRGGKTNCLGDGCSTWIFAEWASQHGAELYSVDISPANLQCSKSALGAEKEYVQFVESDSVEFLADFGQPIDFLYLDSYDFEVNNPRPSQEHHLKEIQAALPWLTDNTVIMIDDCDLPYGGKGALVIEYLVNNGWRIAVKGYQVVLVRA